MADAVLTFNVVDHWDDGKRIHVIGNITNDGGNYNTSGLSLNLSNDLIKGTMLLHAEIYDPNGVVLLGFVVSSGVAIPEESAGGIPAKSLLLLLYKATATTLTATTFGTLGFYGIFSKLI